MRCYVCDSEDKWKKLEGLHSNSLLQICKKCGNLCHEVDVVKRDKMLDYYRKEYRPGPTHKNLLTTTNKLQAMMRFLEGFLKGKKGLLCGDVGAATGYFLFWLRGLGHRVTGSEYTVSFRRVSEHYYQIPLTEELETKHRYDLISMYHVLEHMTDPDKKLEHYRSLLSNDGRMFIATPYWLECIEEQSGFPMQGFDHLFHKDHINVFSKNQLQNLFKKTGLVIEKEDYFSYGQTYLLRAGNKAEIIPDDWQEVEDNVLREKKAMDLFMSGNSREAIKVYPLFPEAHMDLVFRLYGKDPERQTDMIAQLPDRVRNTRKFLQAYIHWLIQYARYDDAMEVLNRFAESRPEGAIFAQVGRVMASQGRHNEAIQCFVTASQLMPTAWSEMQDWALAEAARMPTWDEVATEALKEEIFKRAVNSGAAKLENPQPSGINHENKKNPDHQNKHSPV